MAETYHKTTYLVAVIARGEPHNDPDIEVLAYDLTSDTAGEPPDFPGRVSVVGHEPVPAGELAGELAALGVPADFFG